MRASLYSLAYAHSSNKTDLLNVKLNDILGIVKQEAYIAYLGHVKRIQVHKTSVCVSDSCRFVFRFSIRINLDKTDS